MKSPKDTEEINSSSQSTVSVTREMCRDRAREIARVDGRSPAEVRWEDYFQARRELTGENDPDRQDAMLDADPSPAPVARTAMLTVSLLQMV